MPGEYVLYTWWVSSACDASSDYIITINQSTRVFPILSQSWRRAQYWQNKSRPRISFCPTLSFGPSGMSFILFLIARGCELPPSDRAKAARTTAFFKAGANQINKFHFESRVQKRRDRVHSKGCSFVQWALLSSCQLLCWARDKMFFEGEKSMRRESRGAALVMFKGHGQGEIPEIWSLVCNKDTLINEKERCAIGVSPPHAW